jgi:hypothetical protein
VVLAGARCVGVTILPRDSHIAWLAAATHVAGAGAMLFLLRRGLPGFPEDERLAYMAAHRAAWLTGWLIWQLAAVSVIAFYGVLALRFRGALSVTAMAIGAAAIAIDITCESRYMGVLPELRGEAFARLDRELEVQIGYGANGLYTLAFVLLVIAGWRVLPKAALALAGPVALSGFALSLAALQGNARLETVTSAALFPLFTLWIIVVALWLRKNESS